MKFIRQDGHKQKKLGDKWRKPKGFQSKMRLQKKGYHSVVKIGYGRKAEDKGKDKSGKVKVLVANVSELKNADPKTQNIFISSTIGNRKKLQIFEEAKKSNIELANVTEKMIEKIQSEMKDKKDNKAKKAEKKAVKKATKKSVKKSEASEIKEEAKEEKADDEKKEKREQEKVLIKKQ